MEEKYYDYSGHFVRVYVPWTDTWISSHWLSRHLSKLGKTPQDWYDEFILKIKHSSERPKCMNPNCPNYGKEMRFLGPTLGYRIHCNHKCQGSDPEVIALQSSSAKKAWEVPGYRDMMIRIHRNPSDEVRKSFSDCVQKLWSDNDYYFNQSAKIALGTALAQKADEAYFYIAIFDKIIKIGTTINIDKRKEELGSYNLIIIYSGSISDTAHFEYDSKMKYKDYWLISEEFGKSSETFSIDILDNIKSDAYTKFN